jgi:hypothetical protein
VNYYVVVEGSQCEKKVFQKWIPLINSNLEFAPHITKVSDNSFHLVAGYGYPSYFDVIEGAIEDVASSTSPRFDRLIISVDSEDFSKEEKFLEVDQFVKERLDTPQKRSLDIRIVVQHFCFETWALGNRRLMSPNLREQELRDFVDMYDVSKLDPELLPANEKLELNRAQFAERYLRRLIGNSNPQLTYSKANPRYVAEEVFFHRVKGRAEQTPHIGSFKDFMAAFS